MIEQFEDPRVKVPPPLSQRDPLCKTVQPPKNENNDTEEKLASVQHTLVILSPPLSSSCVLQPLTRNSTKPRVCTWRCEGVCESRQAQWEVGPIVANALLDKVGRK